MRAIIQKSGPAKVEVDGQIKGEIFSGLVILLGIKPGDTVKDIEYLAEKITNLRLFEAGEKPFNKSIEETTKEVLVISQFTLYANCKKGRRPDFNDAARAEVAEPLYNQFIDQLKLKGLKVQTGQFGAMMNVTLTNEGPITIILDSQE